MKRALSAWLLAAIPASLIGHAVAYRILGESMADGRHAYFGPLIEFAIGAFLIVALGALVGALLRAGRVTVGIERSLGVSWLKLAIAQTVVFALLEHFEGYAPSLVGCAVQVVIALLIAVGLMLFGHLLDRCIAIGEASSYRARAVNWRVVSTTYARLFAPPDALCACVGTHRFQRPPPIS